MRARARGRRRRGRRGQQLRSGEAGRPVSAYQSWKRPVAGSRLENSTPEPYALTWVGRSTGGNHDGGVGGASSMPPSNLEVPRPVNCHRVTFTSTSGRDARALTCSSASCATSASTRSPRATGRSRRARPGSSTSRDCSSTSCGRSGSTTPRSTSNGYVTATLPGEGPVDRPDRPRGHEPGRARRGRRADRAPRPRRRADRAAARRHGGRGAARRATTSSPPAATRCSAPTTRPAWPRS